MRIHYLVTNLFCSYPYFKVKSGLLFCVNYSCIKVIFTFYSIKVLFYTAMKFVTQKLQNSATTLIIGISYHHPQDFILMRWSQSSPTHYFKTLGRVPSALADSLYRFISVELGNSNPRWGYITNHESPSRLRQVTEM